jgi:hypothetical protein
MFKRKHWSEPKDRKRRTEKGTHDTEKAKRHRKRHRAAKEQPQQAN